MLAYLSVGQHETQDHFPPVTLFSSTSDEIHPS